MQPVGVYPNPCIAIMRWVLWLPFALMIGATHLLFMLILVRNAAAWD